MSKRHQLPLLGLLLLFAGPAIAGNFVVEWQAVDWPGGAVRYEVGLGNQTGVYTLVEPSTDTRHGFHDLACVLTYVAVRTCPAASTESTDCSRWSEPEFGLPTISTNVFCIPEIPPPVGLVRMDAPTTPDPS